jgi:hypothetical protein
MPTFEFQLPVTFCSLDPAITLDDAELVANSSPIKRKDQPDLICNLCPKINSFRSIIHMWSHIIHQHGRKFPAEDLLNEIRRAALLWKEYRKVWPDTTRSSIETMKKVAQSENADFAWEMVLGWKIR